ncbi:cysteine desulfurase family protein [Leucobacter tenebrionis]|uniref:cysteine desulfurase family protein n=1 Tax=Leucobacter tenebrionis TaxID=2873270 RepID=UPI001CA702E5|nr:cysteine desulfurase family protein [Leucobacter tenebrionis]QZY52827.1 cysteine desulfurase [Leucobacter tenebrionis]
MSQQAYLDHNGTTPVAREALEAMLPYLTERFGNPSSSTSQGLAARSAVEKAREQLAALIGAHPDEIVFTSGGTEANNLAIRGAAVLSPQRRLLTSVVEHPATDRPVGGLEREGWEVRRLAVDSEGRVDPGAVPAGALGIGTLILAQNEVGTIQPIAEVADRVRAAGGVMHADAAQAAGKIPVSVDGLGVDLLSIAGHKLYAPKGVGALYVRRGTPIAPVLVGAGQERGLRPGTENVAGIVALGAAAELAGELLDAESARQLHLRELLWERLVAGLPQLVRVSPADGCLPNTLMVAVPGHIGGEVLDRAPEVGASTGSACHSGTHTPSTTLIEMGLDPDLALGALRLSLGRATTEPEVAAAADALIAAVNAG